MKNNLFKQLMNIVISMSILSQGLLANTSTTAEQDREEFIEYLQSQQEIYKAEFDKEMILENLDYDVDKIIDFVSNKIVYQAYDGVLRGVEGTLIGRAGNSHDQAITLASMLNDADVEAQIMVGELNDAQIEELNQQIASPTFEPLVIPDKADLPKIMKKMIEEVETLKGDSEKKLLEIYQENETIAQNIYNHIPQNTLKKGAEVFAKKLHNSTTSYRWVRYRKSIEEPWIEIHPVYEKSKTWKLSSTSIESGSINADALQKLSIEVWIETSDGKKKSITGKWTIPSANSMGKALSIEISSDIMSKLNHQKNLIEQLKNSHYFFVKINGELAKEGKAFDINGNLYSGDTINGLNSIFNASGKNIKKVNEMFSESLNFGNSIKKPDIYLVKVWLEFTILKPSTNDTIIKRVIFENDSKQKKEVLAMRLLQKWDILTTTTVPTQHYYKFTSTKDILQILKGLNTLRTLIISNADDETIRGMYNSLLPNINISTLKRVYNTFNEFNYMHNSISYSNSINILASRQGFNKTEKYQLTDIISNPRWTFNKDKKSLDIKKSIQHGVWETNMENSKIMVQKNRQSSISAFSQLKLIKTYVNTKESASKQNLFDTNIVNNQSYWNVNIQTGETVGMIKLPQGYSGGALVEQLALTLSSVMAIYGLNACLEGGGNTACCLIVSGTFFLTGYGMGLALATTTLSALQLVAFGVTFDALTFPLPLQCPK